MIEFWFLLAILEYTKMLLQHLIVSLHNIKYYIKINLQSKNNYNVDLDVLNKKS